MEITTNNNYINDNENLTPMKEASIYNDDMYNNNNFCNGNNNIIIEEKTDKINNIIVIRKNTIIKKTLKKYLIQIRIWIRIKKRI